MDTIEARIRQWIEQVVVGMNLCPFAGTPYRNGQIRISISRAETAEALLDDIRSELSLLVSTSANQLETTLLVVPQMLSNFDDYNQFLDDAEAVIRDNDLESDFQIASFHPQYRFHGTADDDPENLTNRSRWPILHFLREASIDAALENFPNTEAIPKQNIHRMNSLTPEERRQYFPEHFS